MGKDNNLLKEAKKILDENWMDLPDGGGFTKPSKKMYPFQWNWDSGFIAYGYSYYDSEKALKELETLFKGQWKNGFLPHMIFHNVDEEFFPGHSFWQSEMSSNAPKNIETSGIIQPPMCTLAIWHMYKMMKSEKEKNEMISKFFDKVYLTHKYLMTKRDPEKWGLVTVYHPWESGFDNSPRWDVAMEHPDIEHLLEGAYKRSDLSYVEDPLMRPSEKEYDTYLNLALNLKRYGYNDEKIYENHSFKIKDVVFSSIVYVGNIRLRKMALVLGEDTKEIDEWIERFEKNIFEKCWSEKDGLFYDYDIVKGESIEVQTAGGMVPMITGLLDNEKMEKVMENLNHADFCGSGSCLFHLLPSTSLNKSNFHPMSYWRGPLWININWLIWKSLYLNGYGKKAEEWRRNMLDLVSEHGFYEYFNPLTGEGLGAKNFSWTAALVIDLLSRHKNGI